MNNVSCRRDMNEILLKRRKTPFNQSIIGFLNFHVVQRFGGSIIYENTENLQILESSTHVSQVYLHVGYDHKRLLTSLRTNPFKKKGENAGNQLLFLFFNNVFYLMKDEFDMSSKLNLLSASAFSLDKA